MTRKAESIDCVKMSRELRRRTSRELSKLTREERVRFLNEFVDRDPLLRKVDRPRLRPN
jgi:hypothetical protein